MPLRRRDEEDELEEAESKLLFWKMFFRTPKRTGPQQPTPNDKPHELRKVEIGFNLISLLDVDEATHCFTANVLFHVFWDCTPIKGTPTESLGFWRPWIQLHNCSFTLVLFLLRTKKLTKPSKAAARRSSSTRARCGGPTRG